MKHKNLDFEIKAEDDGSFVAYGSTFGNVDLVGDIVQKGAFVKSLDEKGASGVKMFLQHNSNDIIGKYTNIYEDEKGLVIEGKFYLGNIQKADETHFLMKEGEITQFSIGYRVVNKSFDSNGNCLLKELDLIEVSPVTFPANPSAQLVAVKTANEMSEKEFERKLRDAVGLSRNEAKTLMSEGFKALKQRDAEQEEEVNEADNWAQIVINELGN
jgi:HK97 family phage prohead protease